ncbi:MAG: S8 family serine peptidase [Thermodesulfovibrionales bacterium]|nr:S8 family serine peptidase [Thermodesulfovibrionales bacterium]
MHRRLKPFLILLVIFALFINACGSQQGVTTGSDTSKTVAIATPDVKSKIISTFEKASSEDYVPDQLIVKIKGDIKNAQVSDLHKSKGVSFVKNLAVLPNGTIQLVSLNKGSDIKSAIQSYMSDASVEYAEPNYKRYIKATTPNDIYFSQQWALWNTGSFAGGTAGADIKAPLAWDYSKGSNSLIVAVIDTGVDYNHEDLFGKIWQNAGENCNNGIDDDGNGYIDDCFGWDFANNDKDPIDDHGHGTHCAGIIGATTNNSLGISGILWNVKIMPLKFLDSEGSGTVAGAISALNYAVRMGAKIINASYASNTFSQAEYDSISAANERGVLFIAAAGNESVNNDFTPSYPNSYGLPNIISVAASDQTDNIASFSNFGPNSVHVAAPGVYILSLIPNNGFTNKDFWPGTSMAAPHVVGLAGLIMTQSEYVSQAFSIYQIRAIIETYVDSLTAFAGKINTGGRINAYKSVTSLLSPTNLQVSSSGPTSVEPLRVHLTWQNNGTGLDNIRIERMRTGVDSNFVEIAQVSPTSTTYTDNAVVGEATYTYRVRGYKGFTQWYVPTAQKTVYTFYTNSASITTPVVPTHFGGGGGCSVVSATKGIDGYDVVIPVIFMMVGLYLIRKKFK